MKWGDSRECAEWCSTTLSGSPAKDFNTRERQHKKKGERHNTSDKSRKFHYNKEKNVGPSIHSFMTKEGIQNQDKNTFVSCYLYFIYKTSEDRQRYDCDFRKTDDIQFCGYRSFHSEANETLI